MHYLEILGFVVVFVLLGFLYQRTIGKMTSGPYGTRRLIELIVFLLSQILIMSVFKIENIVILTILCVTTTSFFLTDVVYQETKKPEQNQPELVDTEMEDDVLEEDEQQEENGEDLTLSE